MKRNRKRRKTIEGVILEVTFQRTPTHPLMRLGWLEFNHRDFTWIYIGHWTYQPEELRHEPKFRSRKEFEDFLRSIGYNVINYRGRYVQYNIK